MCRSIKRLRQAEGVAAPGEIEAAALQYVRKISGYRQPSKVNTAAFDDAVREVTEASQRLLGRLRVFARPAGSAGV
jgi:hypothetical protein